MKEISPLWVHRLEGAVDQLQAIPLWGNLPPFPWRAVLTSLQQALHLPSLEIVSQQSHLIESEALLIGESTLVPIQIPSLSEQAYLSMANAEVEKLIAFSMTSEGAIHGFLSEGLREGYARFLFLKILHVINEQNAFPGLSLQMGAVAKPPLKETLCLSLSFQIEEETLSLRLICPDGFLDGIKNHYAATPSFFLTRFGASIPLALSIEIGATSVLFNQWKEVKIGDLVLLDRCSFDPVEKKGTGILTLRGNPLFILSLENSTITIVKHTFYQEEVFMTRHPHHQDHPSPPFEEEGHLWSTPSEEESPIANVLSSQEIPFAIVVEVARLTLPFEKIAQLKSGNVLDLQVSPHLIVSLTIHGQQVAKGELVKIGESIGVKILSLYESFS